MARVVKETRIMPGLRDKRRSWPTRVIAPFWCLLFVLITAWIVYAAYYWKVPVENANRYWASRLTGMPQAFLGSDDHWHYFALKGFFLHGWILGKVAHQDAARARDEMIRIHIDRWLDPESREYSPSAVADLTGLSFATGDDWNQWWQSNRGRYVWPAEQEACWEQDVQSRWGEDERTRRDVEVREYYIAEIAGRWRKVVMESLFFGGLLLLLWPVWPWLVSTALSHRRGWRRACTAVPLIQGITILTYVAIITPHACLDYGMGAATTLSGPGWAIYGGPVPFHVQYKPGNTILYRQFLELVWDPAVRWVNAGRVEWLPAVPLFVLGVLPYLAGALVLAGVLSVRRGKPATSKRDSLLKEARVSGRLLVQRPA
jgi:hypothetical protein